MCCECKITLDSSWKLTQNLEQFTMATLKGCLQTGLQLSQSFAFFALPSKGGSKRKKKSRNSGNCSFCICIPTAPLFTSLMFPWWCSRNTSCCIQPLQSNCMNSARAPSNHSFCCPPPPPSNKKATFTFLPFSFRP